MYHFAGAIGKPISVSLCDLYVDEDRHLFGFDVHERTRDFNLLGIERSFYEQFAWHQHAKKIVVFRQDVERPRFVHSRQAFGLAFEIYLERRVDFYGHSRLAASLCRYTILEWLRRVYVDYVASTGNLSLYHDKPRCEPQTELLTPSREEQPDKNSRLFASAMKDP